jgi:hypothetical protein
VRIARLAATSRSALNVLPPNTSIAGTTEIDRKIVAADFEHLPAAEAAMSHAITDVKELARVRRFDDFGHELGRYRTIGGRRRSC